MSIAKATADLNDLTRKAERLRGDLAQTEDRIAKIKIFLEMVNLYGGFSIAETSASGANSAGAVGGSAGSDGAVPAKRPGGRPPGGGIRAQAGAAAKVILMERGSRMHTRELIVKLADRGIKIGGNEPVSNLSGILNRLPEFKGDRSRGWGLAEWLAEWDERDANASTLPSVSPLPVEQSPFDPLG